MTTLPVAIQSRLHRTNLMLGALHAVQAAAVLALANGFALPVTGAFLEGPPGSGAGVPRTLFSVPFGPAVAGFLLVAAAAHWVIASPWYHPRYVAGLAAGHNYARWLEYSVSASVMIVLIAMLTGISDVAALLALVATNAAMIFFGALQEKYERPGGGRLPFWLGSVVGSAPWLAIGVYLFSPGLAAEPPGFVYAIYVSLLLCFNAFAVNQWLQYRGRGRWADYVFGERVYMGLSLVAKSLLAWQVFAATLAS